MFQCFNLLMIIFYSVNKKGHSKTAHLISNLKNNNNKSVMNEEDTNNSNNNSNNSHNKKIITMNKLGFLCEIKAAMGDVASLRRKIREEVELINLEERCLAEFKREMESLNQEKMTHVEELRQIHSDINMLDNVQKQSEEDRGRRLEAVREAYHQLTSIKGKVDKMCVEVEMPRMYEHEEEHLMELGEKVKGLFAGSGKSSATTSGGDNMGMHDHHHQHHNHPHPRSITEVAAAGVRGSGNRPLVDNTNTAGGVQGAAFSSSLASLMSGFQDRHSHQGGQGQQPPPYGRMLASGGGQGGGGQNMLASFGEQNSTSSSVSAAASAASAAFRQQPPPMKSCGSCHQQIHRNAPICPLCKAKSRSRHPKRRNNQRN